MSDTVLRYPDQLTDLCAIDFLRDLEKHITDPVVCIDFTPLNFVYPFGTLLTAIGIRRFVSKRKDKGLRTKEVGSQANWDAISYLRYFGFFQFIGRSVGNSPNEAPGGRTYLPITIINKGEMEEDGIRLQVGIKRASERLASVIYPGRQNETRSDMLAYCLRETIRNVFEHARTDECFVMAQRWDQLSEAEIVIGDEGIGVYASLREAHSFPDALTALSAAVKPGISRSAEPDTDDEWQNTGFGLYVLSELGKIYGSFIIASDGCALMIDGENNSSVAVPLHGTILKLHLSVENSDYFSNVLEALVLQGERYAQTIPGARKKASKMSSSGSKG